MRGSRERYHALYKWKWRRPWLSASLAFVHPLGMLYTSIPVFFVYLALWLVMVFLWKSRPLGTGVLVASLFALYAYCSTKRRNAAIQKWRNELGLPRVHEPNKRLGKPTFLPQEQTLVRRQDTANALQANYELFWLTTINSFLSGVLFAHAVLTDSQLVYWICFTIGFALMWVGYVAQIRSNLRDRSGINAPKHRSKLILAIVPLLASGGGARWAFHSPTVATSLLMVSLSAMCFVVGILVLLSRQGDVFKGL